MDVYLEGHILPKLTQKEIGNLNSSIPMKINKFLGKNIFVNNNPNLDYFTSE